MGHGPQRLVHDTPVSVGETDSATTKFDVAYSYLIGDLRAWLST